jgi:hypothetical protein
MSLQQLATGAWRTVIVCGIVGLSIVWPGASAIDAAPAAQQLHGGHEGVLGPIRLHAGLLVMHARSNGSENFAVDLLTQDPDSPVPVTQDPTAFGVFYEMIDATGRYDGARTAILKADDDYYVNVSMVSGPFELTFEQPTPETVQPVHDTEFRGKGQQVTPYFTLAAGAHTVTATSRNSALRVWLYALDDLGGHALGSDEAGYDEDELIDTTITENMTSVTIDAPLDGIYLLSMNPDGAGPREWTVSVH